LKNIVLINKTGRDFSSYNFQKVFDAVSQGEGFPNNKSLNLTLSNGDFIKSLNKKFRSKDSKTDVLSFPTQIDFLPMLGDIIIDIEVAENQKGNRSLESELQYLLLHGILHLLGYDHIAAKDKQIMESKEKKYWKIIKEL